MGKLRGVGDPIPPEKIEGLRQALARDHVVRFKNGSQIEYEDCKPCEGTGFKIVAPGTYGGPLEPTKCSTCGGEKVRLLVERPAGGVARYRLDTELKAAYAMALRGPQPKKGIVGRLEEDSAERWGDEPPW